MWIHLLALGLIDGAGGGDPPPTPSAGANGYAGGDRAWFKWKGQSLYLNRYELARLLKEEEDELERQALKVKNRKGKVRTVSPEVWGQIMASIKTLDLPVEVEPYEDDDEEAMELLLAYL